MSIFEVGPTYNAGSGSGGSAGYTPPPTTGTASISYRLIPWGVPFLDPSQRFGQVLFGSYLPGSLEIALSAESEGEDGYSLQFPPAFSETDPLTGQFTLRESLPAGWKILVRHQAP